MKPVDQTTYGKGKGNCFSAAVASILELPLAAVPYFMGPEDWWTPFVDWCVTCARCYPIYLPIKILPPECPPPAGYSIMSGRVARTTEVLHSVVALDGVMVHDPNEPAGRPGLTEVTDYIILVPLAS